MKKRAVAWLLTLTMVLPLGLTSGSLVHAETVDSQGAYIYMCDLEPVEVDHGTGPGLETVKVMLDKASWGQDGVPGTEPLKDINGNEYEHGIGMHGGQSVTFDLDGQFDRFTASFCPDPVVLGNTMAQAGEMSFQVYLDGAETAAYTTGVMKSTEGTLVECDLDVTGVQTLKIVANLESYQMSDNCNVLNPKLYISDADSMQLLVNEEAVEGFNLEDTSYEVEVTDPSDVKVALADAEGNAIPIAVTYSDNQAAFSISGLTYTVEYKTPQADYSSYIYLCDLEPAEVDHGTGPGLETVKVMLDKASWGQNGVPGTEPLKDIKGNEYEHGIGMHGGQSVTFDLEGQFDRFTASFCPDPVVLGNTMAQAGEMSFQVYLDGAETAAYTTGVMKSTEGTMVECDLDVTGVQTLKIVANLESYSMSDNCNVLNPKLYISDADSMQLLVNGTVVDDFDLNNTSYTVKITDSRNVELTLADAEGNVIPIAVTYSDDKAVFSISDLEYTVSYVVDSPYIYMCDLEPAEVDHGTGPGLETVKVMLDKASWGQNGVPGTEPLKDIKGNEYEHGIGMHGGQSVTFDLDGQFDRFTASFCPDPVVLGNTMAQAGEMSFQIYLDGAETAAYTTGVMKSTEGTMVECDLDVTGVQTLKIVANLESYSMSDNCNVLNPKLYISNPNGMQLLVDGNAVDGFYLGNTSYEVEVVDLGSVEVTLADAQGNKIPTPVTYSDSQAVFRLNDTDYTVKYLTKGKYLYLCDLEPVEVDHGTGPGLATVKVMLDKASWGQNGVPGTEPLKDIKGNEYEHGIGMHGGQSVTFDLDGQFDRFTATLCPDPVVLGNTMIYAGEMSFQVYLDGAETAAYTTGVMKSTEGTMVECDLDVTGVQILKIVANSETYDMSDNCNVLNPKLYIDDTKDIQLYVNGGVVDSFDLKETEYNVTMETNILPVVTLAVDGKVVPTGVEYGTDKAVFSISDREYTVSYDLADEYGNKLYLADLVNGNSDFAVDQNWYDKGELTVLNNVYEHGLSIHAGQEVTVDLEGMKEFTALIGADFTSSLSESDVTNVQILVDGNEVFNQDISYQDASDVYPVKLDVTDKETMIIKTSGTCEDNVVVTLAEAKFDSELSGYSIENLVIRINGEEFEEFDPEIFEYRYLVPEDSAEVPVVEAIVLCKDEEGNSVERVVNNVTQAVQLPDCAIIKVFDNSYMIRFANDGDWTKISTELYDAFEVNPDEATPEFEYTWDYSQTCVMKLFLSRPNRTTGESKVRMTFDEALDAIKQLDAVTAGAQKIVYLVGWQFTGHDDRYPNWDEVNQYLKCNDCEHEDATECLIWLMDEAWKYNTCVSLHINSSDCYANAPDWELYEKNDLVNKENGELEPYRYFEGVLSYRINHFNEWESGFYKARVDELCELLEGRLEKAGTIHSDAFMSFASDQATLEEDAGARAAMVRYWHSKGIDLTSEFTYSYPEGEKDTDNNYLWNGAQDNYIEATLGLMPNAWHLRLPVEFYLDRPATVLTGTHVSDPVAAFIFGSSEGAEDYLTNEDVRGLPENWDTGLMHGFCTKSAVALYLYQFERLELQNNNQTAIYADGLVADYTTKTISKNGAVIRENNNIFVPMTWEEDAVLVYSEEGYTDRTWTFTDEWTSECTSVDVYENSKDGRTYLTTLDVVDGTITLDVEAGQMLIIKAHDDLVENPFTDVSEDAWYYNSVMYAYENGLLTGTSDTTFEPNSPMTRGMLVTVLYRMEGRPEVAEDAPVFPDVNSEKYYAPAISWAAQENLVSGYKDGTFGPEDSITREQIAKILYRYAEYKGYDVTASQDLDGYKDASNVSAYAVKYLKWATAEGLIKGSGDTLNPKGDATRAEISAILRRFIEKYE